MAGNDIAVLPPEIGRLRSLEKLILGKYDEETWEFKGNRLTTLPPEIAQLTNLQQLDLRNNPLPIPPEILNDYRNPAAILNYWLKRKQLLNKAKVIFVGYGAVGKTSLVKRLIDDSFNENEAKTEGIYRRDDWEPEVRNQKVCLRVWDFGGQEIMHAAHQFFLTERSLYLLVLNARKDERNSDIEYWVKLIQTYGKDAPILVIGNKSDESPLSLDTKGLQDKYPQIKKIIPTSCKTGDGIG